MQRGLFTMVPEVTPWRGHIQYINLGNAIEKLVVGAHTGQVGGTAEALVKALLNPGCRRKLIYVFC